MKITIPKPRFTGFPLRMSSTNFCEFRGMLMKSSVYFHGNVGLNIFRPDAADLVIGDVPRLKALKELDISKNALFSAFFPLTSGVLDDHYEGWFLGFDSLPTSVPEGLESVVNLGLSEAWLPLPSADGRLFDRAKELT
jgi:hypothetical protein